MDFDVIVLGTGPAGVAAALRLRERFEHVAVAEDAYDAAPRMLNFVTRTPATAEMSGMEWEDWAIAELGSHGVTWLGATLPDFELPREPSGGSFALREPSVVHAAPRLLFAPMGSSSSWLPEWVVPAVIGTRVFCCSWSDAYFFRGQRIAVVGTGVPAADYALWARRTGVARVYVIDPSPTAIPDPWSAAVRADPEIVWSPRPSMATGLRVDGDGRLLLRLDNARSELRAAAVFLAGRPTVRWDLFDGHEPGTGPVKLAPHVQAGTVVFAGVLTAGLDPFDHAAAWNDGIRAADELVSRFEARGTVPGLIGAR